MGPPHRSPPLHSAAAGRPIRTKRGRDVRPICTGGEMCVRFVREGGKKGAAGERCASDLYGREGGKGRLARPRYLRTLGLKLLQLRAPRGGHALLQPAPRGRDRRARLLLVQDLPDLPRGPAC